MTINWIDEELLRTVQSAGVDQPDRAKYNFLSPLTVTDNPTNDSLDIGLSGSAALTDDQVKSLAMYRQEARIAISSNVSLTSFPLSQSIMLGVGDVVLLFGQSTQSQNGVYQVFGPVVDGIGNLQRVSWASQASNFIPGMRIPIGSEDPVYAGDFFYFTTLTNPVVLGTTSLHFALAGDLSVTERTLLDSATDIATPSSLALRTSTGGLFAESITFPGDVAATVAVLGSTSPKSLTIKGAGYSGALGDGADVNILGGDGQGDGVRGNVTITGTDVNLIGQVLVSSSISSGTDTDLLLKRNGILIATVGAAALTLATGIGLTGSQLSPAVTRFEALEFAVSSAGTNEPNTFGLVLDGVDGSPNYVDNVASFGWNAKQKNALQPTAEWCLESDYPTMGGGTHCFEMYLQAAQAGYANTRRPFFFIYNQGTGGLTGAISGDTVTIGEIGTSYTTTSISNYAGVHYRGNSAGTIFDSVSQSGGVVSYALGSTMSSYAFEATTGTQGISIDANGVVNISAGSYMQFNTALAIFAAGKTNPVLCHFDTGGAASTFSIHAQNAGSGVGGTLKFSGGTGATGQLNGAVQIDQGASISSVTSAFKLTEGATDVIQQWDQVDASTYGGPSTTKASRHLMNRSVHIEHINNDASFWALVMGSTSPTKLIQVDWASTVWEMTIGTSTSKLALYGGTTRAKASAVGQLTDNTTGAVVTTLPALSSGTVWATDSSTVISYVASLAAKINAMEARLNSSTGISAWT